MTNDYKEKHIQCYRLDTGEYAGIHGSILMKMGKMPAQGSLAVFKGKEGTFIVDKKEQVLTTIKITDSVKNQLEIILNPYKKDKSLPVETFEPDGEDI